MHSIADFIGLAFLAAIAILAGISLGVTILRLVNRRDLANKITERFSRFMTALVFALPQMGPPDDVQV
jgi:formate/nitrite transporter FocA (FNT family)